MVLFFDSEFGKWRFRKNARTVKYFVEEERRRVSRLETSWSCSILVRKFNERKVKLAIYHCYD